MDVIGKKCGPLQSTSGLAVCSGGRGDCGFVPAPPCRLYSPHSRSTRLGRRQYLRQEIPESGQRGKDASTAAAPAQLIELLLRQLISEYTS